MGRNSLFFFILLCLILLQDSKGSSVGDETDQSCQVSHQLEETCGPYAHKIIKPMMAYFDQVTQQMDKNNAEMGRKDNEISKLEKEMASSFKDQSIKILEDLSKEVIKSLKQQIEHLSRRNEELEVIKDKCEKEDEFMKQLGHLRNLIEEQNIVKQLNEIVGVRDKCLTDLKSTNEKVLRLETEAQKAANNSKQIDSLKQEVNNLTNSIEMKNNEIKDIKLRVEAEAAKVVQDENLIKSQKEIILAKEAEVKNFIQQQNEIEKEKEKKSCIARDSSGVYNVSISKNTTFEVLCNSDIAGPGWTVIQQRINGKVKFQRDLKTYRNGFGDFWDGDFFLGLEKIHRLTKQQPHELYFHMQRFDGSTNHARYDEFVISGEDDHYRISMLGVFCGNTTDEFEYHKYMKFTTYDHDNDRHPEGNCALERYGGWWYKDCAYCNMNGNYFETKVKNNKGIFWEERDTLRQVKMMIRPKAVLKLHSNVSAKLCKCYFLNL